MPRGVYERKPKVELPTIEEELRASQPGSKLRPLTPEELAQREKELQPTRACSRCEFYEPPRPGESQNGLCRFLPKAEWVRPDGWCGQWKAREGA